MVFVLWSKETTPVLHNLNALGELLNVIACACVCMRVRVKTEVNNDDCYYFRSFIREKSVLKIP